MTPISALPDHTILVSLLAQFKVQRSKLKPDSQRNCDQCFDVIILYPVFLWKSLPPDDIVGYKCVFNVPPSLKKDAYELEIQNLLR